MFSVRAGGHSLYHRPGIHSGEVGPKTATKFAKTNPVRQNFSIKDQRGRVSKLSIAKNAKTNPSGNGVVANFVFLPLWPKEQRQ